MPLSLGSWQRSQLESREQLGPARNRALPSDSAAAQHKPDLRLPALRLVGIRDRHYRARLSWLSSLGHIADRYVYQQDDWRFLAQAQTVFDVLIIHGDDLPRVTRILRSVRSVYQHKIVIVLLSAASPATTASLLQAGADEVMSRDWLPSEAALRTVALVRRAGACLRSNGRQARKCEPAMFEWLRGIHFTASERKLIAVLAGKLGAIVHPSELLRARRQPVEHRNLRALQVMLCHLRKKLPEGVRLESVRGYGYRLTHTPIW